jgi:hypothetical protein
LIIDGGLNFFLLLKAVSDAAQQIIKSGLHLIELMIEHLFRHVSRYHIPLEPCKSDDVKFIAEKLIEATNHFFHLLVFVTKVLLSLCAAVHICLTINFEFTKVLLTNVGVHSLSNLVEGLLCSVA